MCIRDRLYPGGKMQVYSRAGHGTVVRFELPQTQQSEEKEESLSAVFGFIQAYQISQILLQGPAQHLSLIHILYVEMQRKSCFTLLKLLQNGTNPQKR